VQSRAYDTTWDPDDRVGIYMLTHDYINQVDGKVHYANVPYMFENVEENTKWLVPADGRLIYYRNNNPVNFVAYYPYNKSVGTDGLYPVDVTTQTSEDDLKAIDLMVHYGVGVAEDLAYTLYAGKVVPLKFTHKLSKLVITAIPKEDSEIDFKDATLTISGMPTFAAYNLYTDEFSGWEDEPTTDLDMWRTNPDDSDKAEWVAFIIPHVAGADYSGRTFTIKVGTGKYIYPQDEEPFKVPSESESESEFESGKVYTYEFELEE
jgi:hypothetical protein